MKTFNKNFINGRWAPISGGESIEVFNSNDGVVNGKVYLSSKADCLSAVESAVAAFASWPKVALKERIEYIRAIAQNLEERQDELALAISREVGMPLKLAKRIQVQAPIAAWREYANQAELALSETRINNSIITKEPTGVVVAITPWNYPLHQITGKLPPAILAGCAVILKPSELAPISAQILGEAIEKAKLPSGVINIVFGGAEVGEALATHDAVDMISFTGSTKIGAHLGSLAGAKLKRVALELGGKSAGIALNDADPELVSKFTIGSCMLNSGQTCSAITRLVIPENQYEAYKNALKAAIAKMTLGSSESETSRVGPLVSERQKERVLGFIEEAQTKYELIAGGASADAPSEGFFVAPTIFGKVDPNSTLGQEEVFGPVLSVITYKTLDEAISIANGTKYGLAGAVWSADHNKAIEVAKQIRAGQIDINGAAFNPLAPFGGFKFSGIGREGGVFGIDEYCEIRSLQLPQ